MAEFVLVGEKGTPDGWLRTIPQSSVLVARPGELPEVHPATTEQTEWSVMLEVRPHGVMICDLACRGAMKVNGIAVDFATLQSGDVFGIGDVTLRLEQADELTEQASVLPSSVDVSLSDLFERPVVPVPDTFTPIPLTKRIAAVPVSRPVVLTARTCDRCSAAGQGPANLRDAGWLCPACIDAPRTLKPRDPKAIGRFEVLRFLARGGMGAVYEGVARTTGLHVAIKVVLSDKEIGEQVIKRFVREQQISETLRHANVVRCIEVGRHEGRLYIASEYLAGGDASALGPKSPLAQVLRVGADLFRALAYGHSRGIVHRDIKPANILLTRIDSDGLRRAKLADYGLAKNFRDSVSHAAITAMGDTGGSISMMSPEQLLDFMSAGPTADLYSAAATLFLMLTGVTPLVLPVPVNKAEPVQVATAILDKRRVPLAQIREDVPGEVATLIDRLVSFDPAARTGITADEISGILDRHVGEIAAAEQEMGLS